MKSKDWIHVNKSTTCSSENHWSLIEELAPFFQFLRNLFKKINCDQFFLPKEHFSSSEIGVILYNSLSLVVLFSIYKNRTEPTDEPVQVGVARPFDVEISSADVIDGLVVDHERAVRMLQRGVGGQDRVVRLNNGRRHLNTSHISGMRRKVAELWRKSFPIIESLSIRFYRSS